MLRKRVLNIMLANTICLVAQSQTLMAGGLLLVSLSYSGDIVHHVQQHFQFRFQLRHYSLLPYQKLQARQLRQLEQNI